MGPFGIERFCCFLSVISVLQVFISKPYYVAVLHGHDPETVLRTTNGKNIVEAGYNAVTCLMIDGVVTAFHVACQVRWFYLLPMDVVGPSLFVAGMALGNDCDDEASVWLLITLTLLVLFSCIGNWAIESVHRRLFIDALEEKCRRTATEFKLEQSHSNIDKTKADTKSLEESRQDRDTAISSMSSAPVFDLCDIWNEGEAASQLGDLATLGLRQRWLLDPADLKLSPKILGSGSFGLVVRGSFVGTPVAVKIPGGNIRAPGFVEMGNELALLRHLRHPHIVAFHGACVEPEHSRLALVLEVVHGLALDDLILDRSQSLGPAGQGQILNGVCCALRYLHSRNPPVVHGDLKGSNVLVEHAAAKGLWPKLLDFGLSRALTTHARPLAGTTAYMAPEVLFGSPPECASDVFSFGRLLFFVATGNLPLKGLTEREVKEQSRMGSPELAWPAELSSSVSWRAAQKCLEFGPARRPTMRRSRRFSLLSWQPSFPMNRIPK